MKKKTKLIAAAFSLLFLAKAFSQDAKQFETFNLNDVNSFDRMLMNPYSKTLDYMGTASMGLSLLTPAVLFSAPQEDYWKIGIEYAVTIAFAYGVKELCKACVSRARPYMYFDGAPESKILEGDWDDSFISGHSTLSFAAAGFTSFLFCQYYPDSQYKAYVIAGSFGLATLTGCLRLSSGNHFLTDVLCGSAIGTGIGLLVPYLTSLWIKPGCKSENYKMMISPMGFSMQINF